MISALGMYEAFVSLEGQGDEIDAFWKRGISRLQNNKEAEVGNSEIKRSQQRITRSD